VRYLEDFEPDVMLTLGTATLTQEEIVAFAERWDPQPIHIDPEEASKSSFGGLIASGWHTGSLFMSMFARVVLNSSASLGSPGLESIRWLVPVRPGDTLTARYQVLEVTPSIQNPHRGTVRGQGELINQDGRVVLTLLARNLFLRRPA